MSMINTFRGLGTNERSTSSRSTSSKGTSSKGTSSKGTSSRSITSTSTNSRAADLPKTQKTKIGKSEFIDLIKCLGLNDPVQKKSTTIPPEVLAEMFPGEYELMCSTATPLDLFATEATLLMDYCVEMEPEQGNTSNTGMRDTVLGNSVSENGGKTASGSSASENMIGIEQGYRKLKQTTIPEVLTDLHLAQLVPGEYQHTLEGDIQIGDEITHRTNQASISELHLQMQPDLISMSASGKQYHLVDILQANRTQGSETIGIVFNEEFGADESKSIYMELDTQIIDTGNLIDPGSLYEIEQIKTGAYTERLHDSDRPEAAIKDIHSRSPETMPKEDLALKASTSAAIAVPIPKGIEEQKNDMHLSDDNDEYTAGEILGQVEQKLISGMQKWDDREFTFSLKPDGLGLVKVKMLEKEGRMQLEIIAERSETGRLLSTEIDQLRESLKSHNVDLIKVTSDNTSQEAFLQSGGSGSFTSQEQLKWDFRDEHYSMNYRSEDPDRDEGSIGDRISDNGARRIYKSGHLDISI